MILPHYQKGNKSYTRLTPKQKLQLVQENQNKHVNGYNRGQRAKGFGYLGGLISSDDNVLVLSSNTDMRILNKMQHNNGKFLTVKIRYFDTTHPLIGEFVDSANEMGKIWRKGCTSVDCASRNVIGGGMITMSPHSTIDLHREI